MSKRKTGAIGCLVLIICIAFLLIFRFWSMADNPQAKQDKLAIKQVYLKFEYSIRHSNFAQAYAVMSPSYRERYDLESFTLQFRSLQRVDDRLEPQHFIRIHRDNTAWLYPKGASQNSGGIYEFEKVQSKWYLTGKTGIIKV